MRKFALILSLFAFVALLATPQPTSVLLDAAYKTAKAENKKVFVTFHASWCGWCKKMEAFMDMPEFKKIFEDNYVIVPVTVLESKDKKDLENPGGADLLKTLGGDKGGIPFYAIMDANGKKLIDSNKPVEGKPLGQNIGHPMEPDEIAHFMKMLRTTAPRMTKEQFVKIETFLKAQKR